MKLIHNDGFSIDGSSFRAEEMAGGPMKSGRGTIQQWGGAAFLAVLSVVLLNSCSENEPGSDASRQAVERGVDGTPAGEVQAPGVSASGSSANRASEGPLVVHYHERVPYMSKSAEKVTGLTASRLTRVFEAAGVSYEWMETPPRRQMEILRSGRGRHAFLGWFRTPEREPLGQYSEPIFVDRPAVAIARAGTLDPEVVGPVSDVLKNTSLRLLVRDGYSYGSELDALIETLAVNREVTTVNNLSMLRMIHAGRADYFFITEEEAAVAIQASGLPEQEFVRVRFSDTPGRNERHILYSLEVEQELIDRVDEAIRENLQIDAGAT